MEKHEEISQKTNLKVSVEMLKHLANYKNLCGKNCQTKKGIIAIL